MRKGNKLSFRLRVKPCAKLLEKELAARRRNLLFSREVFPRMIVSSGEVMTFSTGCAPKALSRG